MNLYPTSGPRKSTDVPPMAEAPHTDKLPKPSNEAIIAKLNDFKAMIDGLHLMVTAGASVETPPNVVSARWQVTNNYAAFGYDFTCNYAINGDYRVFKYGLSEHEARTRDGHVKMVKAFVDSLVEELLTPLVEVLRGHNSLPR